MTPPVGGGVPVQGVVAHNLPADLGPQLEGGPDGRQGQRVLVRGRSQFIGPNVRQNVV
jgi:hypothetical protein